MEIRTVGVIGAGTMGSGIAQVFAQAGLEVRLVDVEASMLERARSVMSKSLGRFVEKGHLSPTGREEALNRVSMATSLESLADADYLVEAIVENIEVKCELLARLDLIAKSDAILASNTSSISITRLAAATARADRVLGMHFMNPVPLMTLVELVRGEATSPASLMAAHDLCKRLGKTAVDAADFPGFISNRILMPMINEAIYAVMEGVATPEAIDTVLTLGMNHPMGPLTLAELHRTSTCAWRSCRCCMTASAIQCTRPCPLLRRMVAAGRLGRKSGQGFYSYQPQPSQ